jgi:hypothetical protein
MTMQDGFSLLGKIYVAKIRNGEILEELEFPNTLVNTGKAQVAGLINGQVTDFFDYIAIGTGTTAAATTQTALVAEVGTRASATLSRQTTTFTNDTARLVSTFTFNAATAITEYGIFDASASGTMLSRQVYGTMSMSSGDSLQVTWNVSAGTA